jgi:hypothetical protein
MPVDHPTLNLKQHSNLNIMTPSPAQSFDWSTFASKRRAWQPNNPAPNSETSKAPLTISRCLALTALEPAVREFLQEGLDRSDMSKLGPAISTLRRNQEDEVKHELALTRAKHAMVDYTPAFEAEADNLISRWTELTDNPITKAAVLENGVFFIILPIYNMFGSPSLQISSNSISGDEIIHVQSHRKAAQLLGARPSKELNNLRIDTVAWISATIGEETGGKWTLERCLKNSNSLMSRGISDLLETQVGSQLAPYELAGTMIETYA